jgi:hypothetical protein
LAKAALPSPSRRLLDGACLSACHNDFSGPALLFSLFPITHFNSCSYMIILLPFSMPSREIYIYTITNAISHLNFSMPHIQCKTIIVHNFLKSCEPKLYLFLSYIFIRVHNSFLQTSQHIILHLHISSTLTGSYKFLICFINFTMVSLRLYPMYAFLAIPRPCSALILPFRLLTH